MKPNKDEILGSVDRTIGETKQKIGRMNGDLDLEEKGAGQAAAGDARRTAGKARRKVGEVINDIGKKIGR